MGAQNARLPPVGQARGCEEEARVPNRGRQAARIWPSPPALRWPLDPRVPREGCGAAGTCRALLSCPAGVPQAEGCFGRGARPGHCPGRSLPSERQPWPAGGAGAPSGCPAEQTEVSRTRWACWDLGVRGPGLHVVTRSFMHLLIHSLTHLFIH